MAEFDWNEAPLDPYLQVWIAIRLSRSGSLFSKHLGTHG